MCSSDALCVLSSEIGIDNRKLFHLFLHLCQGNQLFLETLYGCLVLHGFRTQLRQFCSMPFVLRGGIIDCLVQLLAESSGLPTHIRLGGLKFLV